MLKKEYCLHYDISDTVFLRASLHEINHMALFDKWCSMQKIQLENEPEYPDILWYLEELAVAPTLNDPRIQRIVPVPHSPYQSMGFRCRNVCRGSMNAKGIWQAFGGRLIASSTKTKKP